MVYKLYGTKTGLYRQTGDRCWGTVGKTWSALSHLKAHLTLHNSRFLPHRELRCFDLVRTHKHDDLPWTS